MNQSNFCNQNGWLVSADGFIPASRMEFHFSAPSQTTGCNRLQCHTCEAPVRYGQGFSLSKGTLLTPTELYEAPDWTELPDIQRSTATLYTCRCRFYQAYSSRPLDAPDPDEEEQGIAPLNWRCAGHPELTLPGQALGHHLAGAQDVEALARSLLMGDWREHAPAYSTGKRPGFALWRLYQLLQGPGLQDELSAVVADGLLNAAPEVRAVAIAFFEAFPGAAHASQLLSAYQTHPDLFDGIADPFGKGKTLAQRLVMALHPQIKATGNPDMLAIIKTALLQESTYEYGRFKLVVERDGQWIAAHMPRLMAVSPRFLAGWLSHYQTLSVDELVERVKEWSGMQLMETDVMVHQIRDGLYRDSTKAELLLEQLNLA